MSKKQSELQRNITSKVKNTSGDIAILGLFILVFFIGLMFFKVDTQNRTLSYQFIEDTISECLSSTGADNLFESYQPHRDSNVGSFVYNGVTFTEIKNTSMFINRLANDFNVEHKNGIISSYDSYGKIVFQISDIKLYVDNVDASYFIDYSLSIPRKFNGYELNTYKKNQVVKYQTRF